MSDIIDRMARAIFRAEHGREAAEGFWNTPATGSYVYCDMAEAALAAQQNSPSADTFEQPFKEGAGVSEDTPTSALGGLSEGEVAEMALHIEREKCLALGNDCRAPDCYCTNIPSSEFVITFAHAIEAALRAASRQGKS